MKKPIVSIVRFDKTPEAVRSAVDLCHGLDHLPSKARVFIKPNIVYWTRATLFPMWGVITTSRVVEDMVILLKERGINDITIGEGGIAYDPKDKETAAHAFETLGYNVLKKRYGIKVLNIFEGAFEKLDVGEGTMLNFNKDALYSDFVVNIPVLKTHSQAVVSLGIKNLKGLIDVNSRKNCHSADSVKDLHYHVGQLANKLPPSLTILDGIYTLERGPGIDGTSRRSNIIIASPDILSVDMVGARALGYDPSEVPHLVHAAKNLERVLDLSNVEIEGERIEDVASRHEYEWIYNEEETLPLPLAKMGMKGISFPKYDSTMCTYCAGIVPHVITAVAYAWKGEPWDDVEVLTGKAMRPTPGMKKTILLGKCMYLANKENPDINEMIAVKGCPPSPKDIVKAFHHAGIGLDPSLVDPFDKAPRMLMKRYQGKAEFDLSFFMVN